MVPGTCQEPSQSTETCPLQQTRRRRLSGTAASEDRRAKRHQSTRRHTRGAPATSQRDAFGRGYLESEVLRWLRPGGAGQSDVGVPVCTRVGRVPPKRLPAALDPRHFRALHAAAPGHALHRGASPAEGAGPPAFRVGSERFKARLCPESARCVETDPAASFDPRAHRRRNALFSAGVSGPTTCSALALADPQSGISSHEIGRLWTLLSRASWPGGRAAFSGCVSGRSARASSQPQRVAEPEERVVVSHYRQIVWR